MAVLNPGWSTLFKPQLAAAYWRGLACRSRSSGKGVVRNVRRCAWVWPTGRAMENFNPGML
jgi:hypothetical protein